jgi:hypothetical protein
MYQKKKNIINQLTVLDYLKLEIFQEISVIVFYFYNLEIFDKQSSATLQKSILVYSMPKASRFGSGPKYCG